MELDYRVVQNFVKIEALGTRGARHGDPADPLYLQVVVTRSDDITDIIEECIATSSNRARLWRAAVGKWVFKMNPALYQAGASYTVHFKFAMTPNNTNVVRQSLIWCEPYLLPHDADHVVVYGSFRDLVGLPDPQGRFVVEEYLDFVTLNQRISAQDVQADIFGNWAIELPAGKLLRFVFGEDIHLVQLPTGQERVAFNTLKRYQPKDVLRTDRFGYPLPG